MLLVAEAGGLVTTIEEGGDPAHGRSICAGNVEVHGQLIERLRAAGPPEA